eukprot:Skav216762  [mRNA]  locus=scaffold1917:96747:101576:+ [translate_table: standard]
MLWAPLWANFGLMRSWASGTWLAPLHTREVCTLSLLLLTSYWVWLQHRHRRDAELEMEKLRHEAERQMKLRDEERKGAGWPGRCWKAVVAGRIRAEQELRKGSPAAGAEGPVVQGSEASEVFRRAVAAGVSSHWNLPELLQGALRNATAEQPGDTWPQRPPGPGSAGARFRSAAVEEARS